MPPTIANKVHFELSDQERQKLIASAEKMDAEKLAKYVAETCWGPALRKLVELGPYIRVLWQRFKQLKKGQTIYGCATKKEFCDKHLHRSIRAVQFLLNGRPKSGGKGANNVRRRKPSTTPDGKLQFQWSCVVSSQVEFDQLTAATEVLGEEAIKNLILAEAKKQPKKGVPYERTPQRARLAAAA